MKTIYTAAALVALALSPAAMADTPTCKVNRLNGACGVAKSDDSAHKGAEVQPQPKPREDEEESK